MVERGGIEQRRRRHMKCEENTWTVKVKYQDHSVVLKFAKIVLEELQNL